MGKNCMECKHVDDPCIGCDLDGSKFEPREDTEDSQEETGCGTTSADLLHEATINDLIDENRELLIELAKQDAINPSHYTQGKIEVIDFIEDQKCDFRVANVIKYVCRHKFKNGLEDLKKARWYLERIIKEEEATE